MSGTDVPWDRGTLTYQTTPPGAARHVIDPNLARLMEMATYTVLT